MSEARTVAAILTCYNEGPYIGEAVRSVLAQTLPAAVDSIVIADDGSDADTLRVLADIESWDPRIRVIYGGGGAGLPAQRNLAIANSTAPLLAILDGDDIWHADKLALQLPTLTADSAVGLCYSGYWSFATDQRDATVARVRDITGNADLTRTYFLNDPPIIPSSTLIRRSAFEACGGFDAGVRVFEDTDLFLRLTRVCRFAFIAKPLLYKRNRVASITGGRRDLMAHHAFVAFKAAAADARLLPLVTRRLSERARKLGNLRLLEGSLDEARQLLTVALQLCLLNWSAWGSFLVARFAPQRGRRHMLDRRAKSSRAEPR